MIRPALLPFVAVAVAAVAFSACGSSTTDSTPPPTTTQPPITAPTPAPTPDFRAQCGEPVPPPLYGMKVKVQVDSGFRKQMDSNPVVENTGRGTADSYCGKVGFDSRALFCEVRQEGNPQRPPCDALVVGRASDTGRYGPTWEMNDKACQPAGDAQSEGCTNHPSNQFLAIARGDGQVLACASSEWPATGARCGGCTISVASPVCN